MVVFDEVVKSPYLFLFECLIGYVVYCGIWRLYFSPLASFPGPRLAALTRWYETYYDVWLHGQYAFKMKELHEIYGPILRISPFELHISDGDFYDTLYASSATGQKRDKYEWWTRAFGMDLSVFTTVSHDHHRLRRSALNPFFSMQSVRKLQPFIQERVDTLMNRFSEFRKTNEVVNLSEAFAAFTNDIVMQYCFARTDNRLEVEDFDPSYRRASFFASTAGSYMRHVPWLNSLSQMLPDRVVEKFHPSLAEFIALKRTTREQINSIISGKSPSVNNNTIFHEILFSKDLPPIEKSVARLTDDAQVLMIAGTLTTAWVFEVSTFYLLRNPRVLARLKAELHMYCPNADARPIHLPTLEALPYLNAVMKETFRLSYGVSGRLARISPEAPMIYHDKQNARSWIIPRGIPVGMSAYFIHNDPRYFPCPGTFDPLRWLTSDGILHNKLDKYLVNFTRGTRTCIGINLAHTELYLMLVQLWSKYGSMGGMDDDGVAYEGIQGDEDEGLIQLYGTGRRDVEIEADSFLPLVQPGSQGIRVRFWSKGETTI